VFDPASGLCKPYSAYSAEYNQRPVYRWFNGNESMLAEPLNDVNAWDSRVATKATPGAKIYAFRPIVNGMVMDRRGFGYDPNFNPNFTMLAAMDAMAGPLKQMGFMRPSGLTAQERAALAQYPNLLSFDVESYIRTGNIRDAVNVGLGRMGMMMAGQDAFGMPNSELASAGANFWSGDVLGLDLPNNPMDPTFNPLSPTEPTGSFISLSHAIKRNGALTCADCHSPSGVMDFRALSYSSAQIAYLQSVLQGVQSFTGERTAQGLKLRWATIPGHTYEVQTTTDLQAGQWENVGNGQVAAGQAMETVVAQGQISIEPQRFFRIREVSQ
jgi:hypothetical protein